MYMPRVLDAKVFRPTLEEFQDPLRYFHDIKSEGEKCGIVKIIPPDGWKPKFSRNDDLFTFSTCIQHIDQLMHRDGPTVLFMKKLRYFHQYHLRKTLKIPVIDGRELDLFHLYSKVEEFGGFDAVTNKRLWRDVATSLNISAKYTGASNTVRCRYMEILLQFREADKKGLINMTNVLNYDSAIKCHHDRRQQQQQAAAAAAESGFSCGKSYTLSSFQKFADDFKKRWLSLNPIPEGTNLDSFIESEYWRTINSGDTPLTVEYGNDLDVAKVGSAFPCDPDDNYSQSPWNLNVMPLERSSLLRLLPKHITGVSQPWCYVGMMFSTFCWHTEDSYLYSISYMHRGAPKVWYGVSSLEAEKFEAVFKFASDPKLLYRLSTMLSPQTLMDRGINVYKTVQHESEFVLTFPRGYHSGFSQGFNFAEAVNFASCDWIPFGKSAASAYLEVSHTPVFAMERLITAAAHHHEFKTNPTVSSSFQEMFDQESNLRKFAISLGIKRCFPMSCSLEPCEDDEHCCVCCQPLFLSAVCCTNCSNRLTCLRHINKLCACDKSSYVLYFQYTLQSLVHIGSKLGLELGLEAAREVDCSLHLTSSPPSDLIPKNKENLELMTRVPGLLLFGFHPTITDLLKKLESGSAMNELDHNISSIHTTNHMDMNNNNNNNNSHNNNNNNGANLVQLTYDAANNVILPIQVGESCVVTDLGTNGEKYKSADGQYCWNVGFKSCRIFPSICEINQKSSYTCEIIAGPNIPLFKVSPSDSNLCFVAGTPTGCWIEIIRHVRAVKDGVVKNAEYSSLSKPILINSDEEEAKVAKKHDQVMKDFTIQDEKQLIQNQKHYIQMYTHLQHLQKQPIQQPIQPSSSSSLHDHQQQQPPDSQIQESQQPNQQLLSMFPHPITVPPPAMSASMISPMGFRTYDYQPTAAAAAAAAAAASSSRGSFSVLPRTQFSRQVDSYYNIVADDTFEDDDDYDEDMYLDAADAMKRGDDGDEPSSGHKRPRRSVDSWTVLYKTMEALGAYDANTAVHWNTIFDTMTAVLADAHPDFFNKDYQWQSRVRAAAFRHHKIGDIRCASDVNCVAPFWLEKKDKDKVVKEK